MKRPVFSARQLGLPLTFLIVCAVLPSCFASRPTRHAQTNQSDLSQQGIYLVFPFQNAGASPRLDWLGEGLEELTIERLSAAGQQVYSHSGRMTELERS